MISSRTFVAIRMLTALFFIIFCPGISSAGSLSFSTSRDSGDDAVVCSCHECTEEILNRKAGDYSCAERIQFLVGAFSFPEDEACIRIARTEFRDVCGPACDPGRCDGKELPSEEIPSTYCGCKHCNHEVWNRVTSDHHTCGARISYLTDFDGLSMKEACTIVGGNEFPQDDLCGLCDPQRCEPAHGTGDYQCGCSRCVNAVWALDADGTTCGERINALQEDGDQSEVQACRQVAGVEYPDLCGTNCDPDLCDAPLRARTPVYCFPDFDERQRHRNLFGNLTVEVKESKVEESGLCDPHDNLFTTNTVSRLSDREIKLQFKKVGNAWEGSEVRIRLPNVDMPFRYGTYSFAVKSVQVVDGQSGEVESEVLPPSIVLSMHTWDATENFAIHENQNHQVGIDITRFNSEAMSDARFAVQPEIVHRFYTRGNQNYQQAPSVHGFEWSPAKIDFFSNFSTSGESESFTYSAQDAREKGYVDYTQCLPADIELRIGLWNIFGSLPPTGMAPNHQVEVTIEDVSYTPNGLEHVPDGGFCSKDCQCSPAHKCFTGICTQILSQYDALIAEYYSSNTSTHMLFGLLFCSCSLVALAFMAYQRMTEKRGDILTFTLSPKAVKG